MPPTDPIGTHKDSLGTTALSHRHQRLFDTAEDAWFWCLRSLKARDERAKARRRTADGERPCEPDDILRWIDLLFRKRHLTALHIEVLAEYGHLDRTPFKDLDEEAADWLLWVDAIEIFGQLLRARGIVA